MKLELDLDVPLCAWVGAAAGSSLSTASGFVIFLETVDQYDVTSLLGGLASVEVEVDEGGEQARGGQQQQHLQQTILH